MSKIINNEGMKPGSIYRIALENFVTYKQVVLFPGPSLNLIIGPNGTGKSTFVCAIILGLCGKTSVIGRAKKISEYVRSGCEQSTIEIELYQEPDKRNVIITRNFTIQDVSTWSIDNKMVREKQVQELIASLNIQVDNLCQLLPQDRVQDFSKMDPQQLLRSTLAAVGGQQSVQQLEELIDSRNQQRGLSTKLQNNAQLMEEQVRLNDRLKVLIDAMHQRKEIEKQIEICEKKKLWIEYQDLREKVIEYTNDRKEAVKLVNSHRSNVEPLEKVMEKAKIGISKLEQQKLTATRETHTLKDRAKETMDSVRNHEYTLKDIESSFKEKMERFKNRERELVEAKAKLDKLITDKNRLEEKVGDESHVKMELAELHKPMVKTNAAVDNLKKQKLQVQYDLENNVVPQMRLYQNKINNLEDVDVKRLETLRTYSEDCYKAVMWLRENKDMFQQPVYEPMMLEINFTDPKFARYLEASVPARDLIAFTFESTRDMNMFLQKVRVEGGLKRVNAICSQGGKTNTPQNNIQQLSYLGFYTYLVDTITAPEAIIRYLCKQYSIHKIPIGNDHTYNNSGKVPANITTFFTENHRFTVRVSAYSGVKSSSTIEIRPARLLANTVDLDKLDNFNRQLSKFEQTMQSHKAKIQDLDGKLSTLEVTLNELNTKRKNINEGVEKVRTIGAQIRLQTKKVQDIEDEPTLNVQQERERCRRKQKECVMKQCRLHKELSEIMKSLQEKQFNGDMWKLLVAAAPQLAALSVGGAMGYPSVLLHQLKANDTLIPLDLDTASWIGSIHGLAGIPSILMPNIMQWRGRRFAFIITCLITVIGWVLTFTTTNVSTLLLSESFLGLGGNSLLAVSMLSVSEMLTPKFRNISMISYGTVLSLGMALVNIMGQYLHWKTVSWLMTIPAVVALLMGCFWPESPSWLACKGEFGKCQQAFVWLRGTDEDAEKELMELIAAQKGRLQSGKNTKTHRISLASFWETVTSRDFYLPSLHVFVLLNMVYWSGIMVILIYATQMIEKATRNESASFLGAIIINTIQLFGCFTASILVKYFNIKSVLLFSSCGASVCLFCACAVTFLQSIGNLPDDSLLCLYCLICYMITGGLGLCTIPYVIAAELMPVKYRGIGGALYTLYSCLLCASSLKLSPYLFLYIDLWGTFLVYMLNAIVCSLYVWKYVPETRRRTLQEIEDYYKHGQFGRKHVIEDDPINLPIIHSGE